MLIAAGVVTPGMPESTSKQELFKGRHFDQDINLFPVPSYQAFKSPQKLKL